MAEKSRISKKIPLFAAQMKITNTLQRSILTPLTKRYTLWGWSDDESDAWLEFAEEAESLYT